MAAVIHSYPLMYDLPVRCLSVLCCVLCGVKRKVSQSEFYNPGISPSAAVRFIVQCEPDAETWECAALAS